VRGRGRDYLLEGMIDLRAADDHEIREAALARVEYSTRSRPPIWKVGLSTPRRIATIGTIAIVDSDGCYA
jgi:hypothetical protein